MSTQKEAVRQQVRLLQAHATEEVEANQAGMI